MPLNEKNIGELISDLMENEGLTVDKLVSQTNIPSRFIVAIKEGELDRLPAEPYVRGYLAKIAVALKADPELLIKTYKESTAVVKSGVSDKLPSNQFARVPFKKSRIIIPLLIAALAAVIFFRFDQIFGVPELTITELPAIAYSESLNISGNIRPGDNLTLNGEIIQTDAAGHFEEIITLKPGLNVLQFKAKRFLGKEAVITKEVYYEKPAEGL